MGFLREFENPNSKTVFSLAKKDSYVMYEKMLKFFNENVDSEDDKRRQHAHNFAQKIIDKMLPTISISEKNVNVNGDIDPVFAEIMMEKKAQVALKSKMQSMSQAEIVVEQEKSDVEES